MPFTPHQSEQLAIATSSKVGILTGSAGTGKSYCVEQYLKSQPVGSYIVCAPTGKAATRLNQTLNCGARTVHTTLGAMRGGYDGGGWEFFYNESNPLPCELLIVDESPMISTENMADLLRAVALGTRVLMLGDPNQLSPVGHGCPVYDMLRSGVVPHGHLTEVHRYAGRIASVANAIKDGRGWKPSEKFDPTATPPENYLHLERTTPAALLHSLPVLMEKLSDNRGFDSFEDLQVICWMNDKGALSRTNLNKQLQKILNPDGAEQDGIPFRMGDKIICTKNHWREPVDQDGEPLGGNPLEGGNSDVYLANGEIGRVIAWTQTKGKKRTVNGIRASFGSHCVEITKGAGGLDLFDPAYAVTCHKFQGAQAKVVIVVADDSADRVATRQGIYTAMTRASQILITAGRMSTIVRQCKTLDVVKRKTFLQEKLQEGAARNEPVFEDSELMEI